MGDRPHGLKDLFGSVPDAPGEAGVAPGAPGPAPTPATPRPAEGQHGLSGAFGGVATDPMPASPSGPGAAPVLNAPNLAPMPPLQPQVPPTPHAAQPAVHATTGLALSCVVVARGGAKAAGRTIQSLRLQTIAEGLDVIVVADEPASVADGFARLQLLTAPPGAGYGEMAAMGVAAASGALVAILDDYAFPARDWAEVIASHRHDEFAALGSALGNANPRSPMSWSNMLLDYGAWREGLAGGTVDRLPARNLVFRRDALAAFGDALAPMLDEGTAATRLAAEGHPLKLQDEARLMILNPSGKRATVKSRFAAGRLAAAERAKGMSAFRRFGKALAAGCGGPGRYLREKPRVFQGSDPTVNPKLQGRAVMIAMTAEGLGRAAGYLRGPGRAAKTRERMRAQRLATLNKVDRKQFVG